MADLLPIDPQEVIAELEREIKMRGQVYGRQVEAGHMKQSVMERRIALMIEAVRLIKDPGASG